MSMEPLPYYKWLVRDYRSNRKVQRMGYIAKGLYRELLDEAWLEGSLPTDMASLSDICGCPVRIMEKAWPEIEQCFEERDGRLFNNKLEDQRTEKDRHRVKMAIAGTAGALAKQKLAKASKSQSEPSKCHIEEESRGEKSRELQKPSRRQAASEDGMKHSADPRHVAFKEAIGLYWESKNPGIQMPWGPMEGKQLGMWLREAPHIDVEQFKGMLRNRYLSDVNHGERPSQWIKWITVYGSGPVDRFGKPTGGQGGKDQRSGANASPTTERINRTREKLAELAIRRGVLKPGSGDGEAIAEVQHAGRERVDRGIHSGLREAVGEVLPPGGA